MQFLPNLRLIGLPSEALGEDWYEITSLIDLKLPEWKMDLSEESVFLLFDKAPGAIRHQEGSCLIARPVIGPKQVEAPFQLKDMPAMRCHTLELKNCSWDEFLVKAEEEWMSLSRSLKPLARGFVVRLRRKMGEELTLNLEVFFHE